MAKPQLKLEESRIAELTLEEVRVAIDRLEALKRQLEAADQFRDIHVIEEVFHTFLYRYVGFELFDQQRAFLMPKKTYVAQSGRYVLLGFSEQPQADQFFEASMKVTL